MPRYDYRCPSCGIVEIVQKMADATERLECQVCGSMMIRIYQPVTDIWHTDGSHKGDYGSGNHVGTKTDALNRNWSKAWGEDPPPPAADVPKNGSEKY